MKSVRLGRVLAIMIMVVLVSACSSGGSKSTPTTPAAPLTISATTPSNGTVDIAPNAAITATFSKAVSSASVTGTSFIINNSVTGTVTYDETNFMATFTPSAPLAYSTVYTATITTEVKSLDGKPLTENYSWQFTTGTNPDTSPPTVQETIPASNATSIAVNSAITVNFSEPLNASTVDNISFAITTAGGQSVSGLVSYNGTTATFTPSASLAYSTAYNVTLTTAIQDLAGNALAANYSWSFTTGDMPDTTAPSVSSTAPVNGAADTAIDGAISVTFSEAVKNVTTATFIVSNALSPVTGTVAHTGASATFTPSSSLAYDTTYTATITTDVQDLAGNPLISNHSWTFTTGPAPDTTAPTILTNLPMNGATDVPVNNAVIAGFSEIMKSSSLTSSTFYVKDSMNNQVAGTISIVGQEATFTPSSNLSNSMVYTATVTAGVQDLAGNGLASNHSWTFTTVAAPDTANPAILSKTPVAGATDVAINAALTVAFDEAMDATTITSSTFLLKYGTTPVSGTVSYDANTHIATFTPSTNLTGAVLYTATITTGVKDLAGNALLSNQSWNFTTAGAISFIDGGGANGINYNAIRAASNPQLTGFNGKLYAIWSEYNRIHVKVYNPNDTTPAWTLAHNNGANGINHNPADVTNSASYPQLTVFGTKLYATWVERGSSAVFNTRVAVYNGDDANPSWLFVDGDQVNGISQAGYDTGYPQLTVLAGKLYLSWSEFNYMRVRVYNGDDSNPAWDQVDANNLLTSNSYGAAQLTEFNGRFYAIWRNDSLQIHAAVYNGDDLAPAWSSVDDNSRGRISLTTSQSEEPQLTVSNGKLYATWREYLAGNNFNIRVAVYNGDDTAPAWTTVDKGIDGGLNWDITKSGSVPQITAFNGTLYACWYEYNGTNGITHMAKFNGDDLAPVWTFVGNGVNGINKSATGTSADAQLTVIGSKLYTIYSDRPSVFDVYQIRVGVYNGE